MSNILSSFRLNKTTVLMNRLAVAPMTTSQSNPDGSLSMEEEAWLVRLAADGYGMVISCAAAISQDSIAFENQLSVEDDSMLPKLAALASRLKKYYAMSIIQLCHAGSRSIKTEPYSASSYSMPQIPGFVPPKMLSKQQIDCIVSDFAAASARVAKAGFNGIEFHGANGYLFTQFMSKMTNQRDDNYGGSLENRARFSREVVRACRRAVPEDFIIGYRISFENMGLETGLDMDENIQLVNWLAGDGIDYVHMSSLDFQSKSQKYPDKNALQYVKSSLSNALPLIGVGGVMSLKSAEQAMEYGADIVAIGRAAIGNVDVLELFAKGEELNNLTPYPESLLEELGISPNFRNYLRKFPVSALNVID